MSMERIVMKKLRELIRLKLTAQLTNRQVAAALNISASTVSYYARAAMQSHITTAAAEQLTDKELTGLIEPHAQQLRNCRVFRIDPDWDYIHNEMQKKHVTLCLLHQEYLQQYEGLHYSYAQFCRYYKKYKKTKNITIKLVHKAGDKCFIDYCGDLNDPLIFF